MTERERERERGERERERERQGGREESGKHGRRKIEVLPPQSGPGPKSPSLFLPGPPDRPQTNEHTALIRSGDHQDTPRPSLRRFRNKYRLVPAPCRATSPGRGDSKYRTG